MCQMPPFAQRRWRPLYTCDSTVLNSPRLLTNTRYAMPFFDAAGMRQNLLRWMSGAFDKNSDVVTFVIWPRREGANIDAEVIGAVDDNVVLQESFNVLLLLA